MYVIATDSRNRDEVLFMVDRKRQKASFWSNRLDDALVYKNESAANIKASSLKFNRPRVLPLSDAQKTASYQEIIDDEFGWDAHKEYTFK